MYEKLSKEQVYSNYDQDSMKSRLCEFSIKGNNEKEIQFICSAQGLLFRKMKTGYWKEIQNTQNHAKGYNVILVNKKQYSRAKLILFAFNKINLDDKNKNIYHINTNKLDCNIDNLTLEVPQKRLCGKSQKI